MRRVMAWIASLPKASSRVAQPEALGYKKDTAADTAKPMPIIRT